jgi:uncharacterized Zn finger protein
MADFAEYGRPRRVDGGLRARSTRGAIGRSWWSRRFLDVLESFALGTRLTRGRSYARAGQVLSLDVAPGTVTARVQGSRPQPYVVRVALPVFPASTWARLEELLAAQALFSARLLAGDLPPDVERLFGDAGAPLFPAAIGELDMHCSCPDFAVPCKHLAATFYLLAEAFDVDPFQVLHWRGRSREELLAHLRALRTGGADRRAPAGEDAREELPARVSGTAPALADLPAVALTDAIGRFWSAPVPLPARPATPAAAPDLLLRQRGTPAAALGGPSLVERLRRAYARFEATAGQDLDVGA